MIQPKWLIYGTLFMFAVILFLRGVEWIENGVNVNSSGKSGKSGKEGFSSALAKTAKSSDDAPPTPIETSDQTSTSKSGSKLSACGDGCDSYATIQATLNSFNNLNKKNDESTAAIQKVDTDIIKLSESAKNMGKQKVPGGKPQLPKKM